MSTTSCPVKAAELVVLESRVQAALARGGDVSGLTVLGYGEISSVLQLDAAAGKYACKRLPRFDSPSRFESYRMLFEAYLHELRNHGIIPVESWLMTVPQDDSTLVAYVVQPLLDPNGLANKKLGAVKPGPELDALIDKIVSSTMRGVSVRVGVDAQVSNWVFVGDQLRYLDVTTPMLTDDRGRSLLDTDLFLASLPALLRGLVKLFVLPGILRRYHNPRSALRDVVANLHKEKLQATIPAFLERINKDLEEPLSAEECEKDYRSDASTWDLLQKLRQWDRAWQMKVRRRVYPFLLPGPIQR